MQTTTKKVKENTKGQKQIVAENKDTLAFYRNMILAGSAVHIIGMIIFSSFKTSEVLMIIFSVLLSAGCYQVMAHMAKPKYSDSGSLIDSGADLNIFGGISENIKDIIILTSICQVLTLYSNYFWLLLLFIPIRGAWILWNNVLSPYLNQPAPVTTEQDEKKQRKLERRMRRQQNH